MSTDSSILQAIGNTSLVRLSHIVPDGCAKVFVKLEWENPTGSMKDRAALAMISKAEKHGRLKPGDTIVEGIGYTPPLWEPNLMDEIITVGTDDAKAMARRLAREEGLFAGTSSGANVVAAIKAAERLGPDAGIVTLMVDSGLKYLSTDVYK